MTVLDAFQSVVQQAIPAQSSKRRVLFVLLPQVLLLDLAGPAQVFHTAMRLGMPYELLFCASQPEVTSAPGLVLAQLQPLMPVTADDLVIVPGLQLDQQSDRAPLSDSALHRWLRVAYDAGATVASVCTGAFVLGASGLLDGRRCTTHWDSVAHLQKRYPHAHVLDKALFVHDGRITTSAGVASGVDMALSLLEQLHGPLFTAQVARYLVIYMRRNGAHEQDSIYLQYRTHVNPAVHHAQDHLIKHLTEPILLQELAAVTHQSVRSLTRGFKEATGLTPIQYHQRLQLELAKTLLNDPDRTIEEVARQCGFEDARHFRRLWQRQFGVAPSLSRYA